MRDFLTSRIAGARSTHVSRGDFKGNDVL